MQLNQVVEFYNLQSTTYDVIAGYSYWEKLYLEYNKLIKKHLNVSDHRIIDLGCGTGLTSDLLVQNNNEVFGLDITWQLLKAAQKRHSKPSYVPIHGDITHLPFKDKSAEGIVCFDTLEHIEPIEKAISEISRICVNGGTVLLDVPSSRIFDLSYFVGYYGKKGLISALKGLSQNKVMFEWESLDDNYESKKVTTYRYNAKYFEELIKSHGFTILEKRGVHISTMIVPEKIQANTASSFLTKINNRLDKFDDFLNRFSFFKNHALYILYACRMEKA
jgi:ubiquinone/menaquinone biosynthesis C-methylase UbiE